VTKRLKSIAVGQAREKKLRLKLLPV